MRKKLIVAGIIGLSIATVLFSMDFFLEKGKRTPSLWNQISRRLFDDDLPKEKPERKREFDMTDI